MTREDAPVRLGVLPVVRPTFDVAAATDVIHRARAALEAGGHDLVGPGAPVVGDDDAVRTAARRLHEHDGLDAVVILQGTFTTSTGATTVAAAGRPVVVWSFPEPATTDAHDDEHDDEHEHAHDDEHDDEHDGRRLRLNSLCGATLASYSLQHVGADVRCVHGDPDRPEVQRLVERALAHVEPRPDPVRGPQALRTVGGRARELAASLRGVRIGRLGEPPAGFEPCEYDAEQLLLRTGIIIDELPLDTLFAAATATPVGVARRLLADETAGTTGLAELEELDPVGVDRSVRLLAGMRRLVGEHGWSAVCTRCWPECMAHYGGAACWPSARMADARVPAGCEADVLGTVTGLVLQELADAPAFLADLVAVDTDRDTATLWHCGVAPTSLARTDAPVRLAGHPNRGTPLTVDAALAPGRITIARLTRRPDGELALVIGAGEILDDDADLHGTSAVVRFDHPVGEVLDRVLGDGLDHHLSLVHGDVSDQLEALAATWGIGVIDLWATGAPVGSGST